MHGFSTVDGFVEINECLAEMIKYLANEPSVGLFFVQQHTQKAVPNVIKHKKNVLEKSHETSLHTQDLEDSVTMVKSIKECGFPIAEEMIGDIRKSLVTLATKQPKRGLIHQLSTDNKKTEKMGSWGGFALNAQEGGKKRGNYFSSVFSSARQKSSSNLFSSIDSKHEMNQPNHNRSLSASSVSISSSRHGTETDELPLTNQVEGELEQNEPSGISDNLFSVSEEKYSDFKAIKEAQLEKWLEGTSNHDENGQADAERL